MFNFVVQSWHVLRALMEAMLCIVTGPKRNCDINKVSSSLIQPCIMKLKNSDEFATGERLVWVDEEFE